MVVASVPSLAPLRGVDLRVVPEQRPERWALAAPRRASGIHPLTLSPVEPRRNKRDAGRPRGKSSGITSTGLRRGRLSPGDIDFPTPPRLFLAAPRETRRCGQRVWTTNFQVAARSIFETDRERKVAVHQGPESPLHWPSPPRRTAGTGRRRPTPSATNRPRRRWLRRSRAYVSPSR